MKDFKRLKIWQKGMEIVKEIYVLGDSLPKSEMFGLRQQLTRAAISIPSNISEGSAKSSKTDYKRFIEMALGSAFELETQVLICQMLNPDSAEKYGDVLKIIDEEQKMLQGFINTLKNEC